MKTGVELIAIERQEQIEKHGWNLNHDADYGNGELIAAAQFCLNVENYNLWPWHDSGVGTYFYNKIINKPYEQRVIIAGAFCAAELDRLNDIQGFVFDIELLSNIVLSYTQALNAISECDNIEIAKSIVLRTFETKQAHPVLFTESQLIKKINEVRDRLIVCVQNDPDNAIKNMYELDLSKYE